MKKSLSKNDIPLGYTWSAVDSDGIAFAYKQRPQRNPQRWYSDRYSWRLYLGDNFNKTNWKSSLVKIED